MFRNFRRISFPQLAQHRLRTALTAFGIGLGVATIVGLRLTFEPITQAVQKSLENLAGRSVFRIANGSSGVPEELLDEIRGVPGVSAVSALIQGLVPLAGASTENLYLFGVDLLDDHKIRDYEFEKFARTAAPGNQPDDPLIFLAKADSVALTADFMARLKLKVGDQLEVQAPSGKTPLTIRAALDSRSGPASAFGGRIALMDIFAAQRLFQLGRRFSEIAVAIQPGTDLRTIERLLIAKVAGRGNVERQEGQAKEIEDTLKAQQANLLAVSALAIILGFYLIFNTMTIAVAQRWREIGILRSFGMLRRGVIGLVLLEAAGLGVAGGLIGVPFGIALARFSARMIAPLLAGAYAPFVMPPIPVDPGAVLTGLVTGVLTSVLAALIPAFQAIRIHPLEAIRRARQQLDNRNAYTIAAIAGLLVMVLSARPIITPGSNPHDELGAIIGSVALAFVAVSLLAPMLFRVIGGNFEPLCNFLFGNLGSLASRNIVRTMNRVAITGTAFLMSLVMAIAVVCFFASIRASIELLFHRNLGGIDVMVLPVTPGGTLPAELAAEIARINGVMYAASSRQGTLTVGKTDFTLLAIDSETGAEVDRRLRKKGEGFNFIEGDPGKAYAAFRRGAAVLIDEGTAHLLAVKTGGVISIPSPEGQLKLQVAGITRWNGMGAGAIFMSLPFYQQHWRDHAISGINVLLKAGFDPHAVINDIALQWGTKDKIYAVAPRAFTDSIEQRVDQGIAMMLPAYIVAVLIALLGLMNSLFASIIDRVREIGVTRAVGGTRGQVVRMVIFESVILGLIGAGLSVPFGIGFSFYELKLNKVILHRTMDFAPASAATLFTMFAIAVLLAAVVGYFPGRRAAGLTITDALQSE